MKKGPMQETPIKPQPKLKSSITTNKSQIPIFEGFKNTVFYYLRIDFTFFTKSAFRQYP